MAWNITERFPSWGETGEFPAAGFFYEGGDQVNEKHLDALWNGVNGLEEDIQAALNDIDSNADGEVDAADISRSVDSNHVGDGLTGGNEEPISANLGNQLNIVNGKISVEEAGLNADSVDGQEPPFGVSEEEVRTIALMKR